MKLYSEYCEGEIKQAIRDTTRAIRDHYEKGRPVAAYDKGTNKRTITSNPQWDWNRHYYRPVEIKLNE